MDYPTQTTDPLGEADVTASQGLSDAVETQPAETSGAIDGGQEAETGQASNPWDNDPRFKGKSSEEMYKVFADNEKFKGELGQKATVADLIQEKYGLTPEQFKAQIDQQEHLARQQRYADNPLAPIVDEVRDLRAHIERQEQEKAYMAEERELDGFLQKNPEYAPFKDKILKLGLNSEQDKSYDEIAREWFGEARAQGQTDAYKKIDTKRMTQATGAQSAPQKRFSEEDMNNMTAAELEAILPHADTSNRPY